MSKELRCDKCKKKVITERENTLHTTYSTGLCDECKPKPEEVVEELVKAGDELAKVADKPNPLTCTACGFIAKSELGLKSHMRTHK